MSGVFASGRAGVWYEYYSTVSEWGVVSKVYRVEGQGRKGGEPPKLNHI